MSKMERTATTAARLAEAMNDAGKKQIDLANETGLSHSTISRYLSGAVEPRQDATHKLAVLLNVSELWLWGYDVPKTRTPEQKRNTEIAKHTHRMLKDPEFLEAVSDMAELTATEFAHFRGLLTALRKK